MASSNGKIASTCWEISYFSSKWRNYKNSDIFGGNLVFGLSRFELFYNPVDLWGNDRFGVVLKELIGKRPLTVNLRLWFKNKEGQKFQNSVQKHTFSKEGDRCGFYLKLSDFDHTPLSNLFAKCESLYICCEITDLNYQATVPITDFTQQFYQGALPMYEEGAYDAIIKVGQREFRILKSQFIARSGVFKQMFTLNFKERKTSTVEIKDVSEQTMEQLVKWIYTCQIGNQGSIEDLFEAADKYQIHLLKINCAELMINSLNNANVFRRLILAVAHNEQQLKEFTLKYIARMSGINVASYFASSDWIEFGRMKSAIANEIKKTIDMNLNKWM